MLRKNSWRLALLLWSVVSAANLVRADEGSVRPIVRNLRGALLIASEITDERIEKLKSDGITGVVILLQGGSPEARQAEESAAARVGLAKLELIYWIEVARCPELADAHPTWMASLQGHPEWRRLFPGAPLPADDEVIKTYPWVPILSKETFAAQLKRVEQLLADRVAPVGVFLNDLQGAPSSCGCGNTLCRWTSDYGKKRSTTPLDETAAAAFVKAVQITVPKSAVIPVWTTECEEHDGAKDGLCAGVGCFKGICWKSYAAQLEPLAKSSPQLGVLMPYREFQRDLPVYGEPAGWIHHALESFETMPRRHAKQPVKAERLITVLQGWDVTPAQIAAQIKVATDCGAVGYIVAYAKIDQSWRPKVVKWQGR